MTTKSFHSLLGLKTDAVAIEILWTILKRCKSRSFLYTLGIFPKDSISYYALMFLASRSTTVEKWGQPKCPSADKIESINVPHNRILFNCKGK